MKRKSWLKRLISGMFIIMLVIPGWLMAQQNNPAQQKTQKEDSAKFYINKGNMLRQQRRFEEALKAFANARNFQPSNEGAIIGQRSVYYEMGRTDDGLKVLDEWVKIEPKNTKAWLYIAFDQAEMGNPEKSLNAFDMLIELQPDSLSNWIGRAQVLLMLKRYNEALKSAEKAISKELKAEPVTLFLKSYSLAKLGKYEEALTAINKAIALSPKSSEGIYNRACIYSLKGDKTNALSDLKKAIEMNPSLKERSRRDEDFKSLYNDVDFKKLTE